MDQAAILLGSGHALKIDFNPLQAQKAPSQAISRWWWRITTVSAPKNTIGDGCLQPAEH